MSESKDRLPRRDARESRRALLEAARELAAEEGPHSLTVVAVARRAGLNRSTAYQHFRTREELLDAMAALFTGEVRELFLHLHPFNEEVDHLVSYFAKNSTIARIWMFHVLEGKPGATYGFANFREILEKVVAQPRGQKGVDPEMLGVITMAAAMVWALLAPHWSPDDASRQADTARFANELKRLLLFGALCPEQWPDAVAALERD